LPSADEREKKKTATSQLGGKKFAFKRTPKQHQKNSKKGARGIDTVSTDSREHTHVCFWQGGLNTNALIREASERSRI